MEQPQPFGKVVVTTGGTPTRATANQVDPTARVAVQSFMVQVLPGNTGLIYVRQKGSLADDRTNLLKTVAILPAPGSATTGPFPSVTFSKPLTSAGFNLADIYIDASVDGEGALIVGTTG